jgi:uncharacterized protein YnzC (UPF0291/DUF896 family)
MTNYRYEPFKDLTEALLWCAGGNPLVDKEENIVSTKGYTATDSAIAFWNKWQKAIPIEKTYRKFYLWEFKSKHFCDYRIGDKQGNDLTGFYTGDYFASGTLMENTGRIALVLDEDNNDVTEEYLKENKE